MRLPLTILAAGALLGAPAAAVLGQPSNAGASADLAITLVQSGPWEFRSLDRFAEGEAEGRPVCTETWTFRRDGTATLVSGEQQVEQRWRSEVDTDGYRWLYTTGIAATAGPDCTGTLDDPASYPRREVGIVLFSKNGTTYTCRPPTRIDGPDGRGLRSWSIEGCYGTIRPRAGGGS